MEIFIALSVMFFLGFVLGGVLSSGKRADETNGELMLKQLSKENKELKKEVSDLTMERKLTDELYSKA